MISLAGCSAVKPAAETESVKTQVAVAVDDVSPAPVNFSDQTTWLLGYFNPGQLTREPHSSWYIKGYDDYEFDSEAINRLLETGKDGITIKIVMGTWCPDSRREVPRFMKVLDIWQFPIEKVTFIGVDDAKLSPVGEYDKLDIQRVPTFIIYKNIIEKGRIIENPATSLEQDIVNILARNE
jgi:thiol-disulfide isomerase/thioredoxin